MTTIWHYRTPVGVFWIRPQPNSDGRWWLGVGDEMPLGSYHSPEAAASDMGDQVTGWSDWDLLRGAQAPRDLSEWTPGPPPR
ncbi:hypothetical protein J421_5356 (plasmid) [Gemmatirosa kalamazoonensis]|uniref:Uncharacterized protein n=1 Tax=Gemmatirosa kalamazoonensis TaxID=861299 RepID=W0RTF9_9BACT|nr:hypothetical protein J421_5338 [Gemmatirosa kalamazoonensis]AHG92882.1 hypothetical protein J421_5347 [Gemmatirosa kalamazoonensis]AHG92891.1 hypothetical protein J421_5356 [Gemmatirosa kalamazoonensis]